MFKTSADMATFEPSVYGEFEKTRILFVCSSGGHLAQLMSLQPWWVNHLRRWVTFDLPDTRARLSGEPMVCAHFPTTRHPANLLRNTLLAYRTLRRYPPDVIMSTGAGVAVPFFAVGRLMGIPLVYIEVIDRIDSSTVTGKICQRLTKNFCVQTQEQLVIYPDAVVVGTLL